MANSHCAEVRATHRTIFTTHIIRGHIILQCSLRVEAEVKLILPPKLIACLTQRIIATIAPGCCFG